MFPDVLKHLKETNSNDIEWIADKEMLTALYTARKGVDEVTHGAIGNSVGDYMDAYRYQEIYDNLPPEVIEHLGDWQTVGQPRFFLTNQFNFTNLGSISARRMLNTGIPENIVSIYAQATEQHIQYAKDVITYMDAFHTNAETSLKYLLDENYIRNAGFTSELDAANAYAKMLKTHPEYKMSVLVNDPKIGARLIEVRPQNGKQLLKLKDLNPVIQPYAVFSTTYDVVNKSFLNIYGKDYLNRFSRLIYMYKMGFLMHPGVILRNFIDGKIKNYTETGDPFGIERDSIEAIAMYNKYDDIVKDIIKSSGGLFTQKDIDYYFKYIQTDPNMLNKEEFFFIHNYITSDVSAGLMGEIEDYYKPKRYSREWENPEHFTRARLYADDMAQQADKGGASIPFKEWNDAYEAKYVTRDKLGKVSKHSAVRPLVAEDRLWNGYTSAMSRIMKPNQYVEQYNRLGLLINMAKRGDKTTSEMYYRLVKVHFDYGLKTPTERMIELFLPFYSFTMKNLHYWAEVVMEKPWAVGLFRDIMTPIWNFDSHTPEELQYNYTLQNQILRGNIQLFDSGLTLKVNPSMMDAYSIMTDPINALKEKLNPVLSYVDKGISQDGWAKAQNIANLVPMGGAVSSLPTTIKNVSETKNPAYVAGSIFGRTYPSFSNPRSPRNYNINATGMRAYLDKNYVVPRYRANTLTMPTAQAPYSRLHISKQSLARKQLWQVKSMIPYRIKDFSRFHVW
jgi:hypothetical protein